MPDTIEHGELKPTLDRGGSLVSIKPSPEEIQRLDALTDQAAAPQSPIGMSSEPKGCPEIGTASCSGGFLEDSVT